MGGNCNIKRPAHAGSIKSTLARRLVNIEMTGERHTPRCIALITICHSHLLSAVANAKSPYWSPIGAFDACQGFKEARQCDLVDRHYYALVGRSECVTSTCMADRLHVSSPFPARGVVFAPLGICLESSDLVRTASARPVALSASRYSASLHTIVSCRSLPIRSYRHDVACESHCIGEEGDAAAHHRSECELSMAISREVAASYRPGLAAAVLTLHVRVAISGGSKLQALPASTSYYRGACIRKSILI